MAYAERKNRFDPRHPPTVPVRDPAARRDLWRALNSFVQENGAWVTSVPGAKIMRIEISEHSSLADRLRELGYLPIDCGMSTRITASGFAAVSVIEIDLPR